MYICSPSVHVDATWTPVKKHIKDVMKVDDEKETTYYEHYDPVALQKIETQHQVIDFKEQTKKSCSVYYLLMILQMTQSL